MLPSVNVEDEFLESTFKNSNNKNGKEWSGFPNLPSQHGKPGLYPEGFATGQSVWDPKFLSQINKKLKILSNFV